MSIMACKVEGCERKSNARGYCHACYEGLRLKGLLPPKECRGCGGPCPGPKWYCNEQCRPRCSVAGCDEIAQSRGWCTYHYTRWKLAGDPTIGHNRTFYEEGQLCSFDGCDGAARKTGLCESHYNQTRIGKELAPLNKKNKRLGFNTCCINGCRNPLYADYLCNIHYTRMKRTGTTRLIIPLDTECRYPKCQSPRHANGWCLKHWKRLFVSKTPAIKKCTQCGTEMRMWEEDHNGRLRPRNRNLCGECTRPTNLTPFVPFLVERDGPDCKLCGTEVDLSLPFPDPMSKSVDHVIPYSLGGGNHVDNYQLAHYQCNIKKGNRLVPPS